MRLREQMPELTGATRWLNGAVKKADLIGDKPTLIHFWSISCNLCKKDMPTVNKLIEDNKNKLHVIAVHMPRSNEDLDLVKVKKTAREFGINRPIFVDNEHALTDVFRVKYVPAYYVFDAEGKLRHSQSGGGGMSMLCKRINRILRNDIK